MNSLLPNLISVFDDSSSLTVDPNEDKNIFIQTLLISPHGQERSRSSPSLLLNLPVYSDTLEAST